jgi:hypothetical protein
MTLFSDDASNMKLRNKPLDEDIRHQIQ